MITLSLPWWVAIAFALQAAAANLAGFTQVRFPNARGASAWRAAAPYVRALWFVGVPYLALINGSATPDLYALVEPDWRRSLEIGAPVAALALALGALLIWLHARSVARLGSAPILPAGERRAQLSQPWGVAFVLLDSVSLQAHWLFYRAGATLLVGSSDQGALAGMALVLVEWAVDLRWWLRARTRGQAEELLMQVALLVLSTILMIYTHNFWFVLAAHTVVWLAWLALMQWCYRPLTTIEARPEGDVLAPGVHDA